MTVWWELRLFDLYFDLYDLRNETTVKFSYLIWRRVVILKEVGLIMLYQNMLPWAYTGLFVGTTLF